MGPLNRERRARLQRVQPLPPGKPPGPKPGAWGCPSARIGARHQTVDGPDRPPFGRRISSGCEVEVFAPRAVLPCTAGFVGLIEVRRIWVWLWEATRTVTRSHAAGRAAGR